MADTFTAAGTGLGISGGLNFGAGQGAICGIFNNYDEDSDAYIKISRISARPVSPFVTSVDEGTGPQRPGRYHIALLSNVTGGEALAVDKMNTAASNLPAAVKILARPNATVGSIIGRRHGKLHSVGQSGAGIGTNPSAFFIEYGDGNSFLQYGLKDKAGTQALTLNAGESVGLVPALDSQSAYPQPRSYHCTIVFSIGSNAYMARGIVTPFPEAAVPFIAIVNGAGSGVTVKVRDVRFHLVGLDFADSSGYVFENKPFLNYIKTRTLTGGENVTPFSLGGANAPAGIVLKKGTYQNPLRYQPQLTDAVGYTNPFQSLLNPYSNYVWATLYGSLTQNIKQMIGTLRRETQLVGAEAPRAANRTVFSDFQPNMKGFDFRKGMDKAIILRPQEGLVIASLNTLSPHAQYYWEAEFLYMPPPDTGVTTAHAYAM